MLPLAVIFLLTISVLGFCRARRTLWPLTLRAAWLWGIPALLLHIAATGASLLPQSVAVRDETLLHFCAAAMLLAPGVSVLGARRPGVRAWPWFVTLPMLAVLLWPAVNEAMQTSESQPLQLGGPAMPGILIVLVMTGGNYFGTRNTAAVLLCCGTVLCHLSAAVGWVPDRSTVSAVGALLFAIGVGLAQWNFSRTTSTQKEQAPTTREAAAVTWAAFRDLFGIVWAKRVADRVNQFAGRESWSVELTIDGFQRRAHRSSQPESESDISDEDIERPLHVLCWILKRFADADWFVHHIGEASRRFPETVGATASDQAS